MTTIRLLKPFACARLEKLSPKARRRINKLTLGIGCRSDPFGINNREGATHYFFMHTSAEIFEALKGEAEGLVWEVTHGQYEHGLPATQKQWASRIAL